MTFERLRAGVTTVTLCLAVLSPMIPWKDGERHDDYPLSWYPMFRGVRPAKERVIWVRATLDDGTTRRVNYRYWTPGGLSEGRRHLERAVREGDAADFCARIADEFATRTRGWQARATTVEIVRSTFVLSEYFGAPEAPDATRGTSAAEERIVHRCEVRR